MSELFGKGYGAVRTGVELKAKGVRMRREEKTRNSEERTEIISYISAAVC